MSDNSLLSVENLTTEFMTEDGEIVAIEDVAFQLDKGERLGIVGESGSGKSVTARSIMRLLEDNGRIAAGTIQYKDYNLIELSEAEMSDIRGNEIVMMLQDPTTALTSTLSVETQIIETLLEHNDISKSQAKEQAIELLEQVRIPDPESIMDTYPSDLSGGQQQRVLLAIVMACSPDLLIADEPTTALDVTIQAQVLDIIDDLVDTHDMSFIHITHDLGVIAEMTDRVAVMYSGRIVEKGATEDVFLEPRHPYTSGLLRSTPRKARMQPELMEGTVPDPQRRPDGCNFAPRCPHAKEECRVDDPPLETHDERAVACVRTQELGTLPWEPTSAQSMDQTTHQTGGETILEAKQVRKEFTPTRSLLNNLLPGGEPPIKAVDGVDLTINSGETVGLVGESGSGKTTLGRVLIRLTNHTDGDILFDGEPIEAAAKQDLRSRVQFIFQDPNNSLNPRQTIGQILGHAVRHHNTHNGDVTAKVESLLEEVGLDTTLQNSYPFELSGGQRQRVGIARALSVNPDVLIADEPTSALDVSVQGQILNLLNRIKQERDLAMLFISHDLSVVRQISNRLAVIYMGKIVETGDTDAIFENPKHPYTEALISATPLLNPRESIDRILLEGEIPDPKHPPEGCNFVTRCPEAMEECHAAEPALVNVTAENDETRKSACFLHHHETTESQTD
ncbi:MAG: dipeptide ABC transporter ATP-binding protein [Halobacteriaceae archaeon]